MLLHRGVLMSKPVRVRFAPSPTGYLHVGGARTALYNYLFAKQNGGQFILRIEDTDLERSTNESLRMQIDDLMWLGLQWDEGVDPVTLKSTGPFSPYRQSERLSIYNQYAQILLEKDLAYYDFRTDDDLEEIKKNSAQFTQIPRPDPIVSLSEAKARIEKGEKAVIRFKVEGGTDHVIHDLVRGDVRLPEEMVGDFVLMRSNGMPVYNFCCAIDDALMEITHVFRAEEHLSNTLRQKMIYDALGFQIPQFGHLSLILGEDKQKLSKRHGATSCNQYKELGYLPEALLNFIALLGWSPGEDQEILTLKEMIEKFDVSRLNPSGAVFDEEKFKWMNGIHLRSLPHEDLWRRLQPIFKEAKIDLPDNKEFIDRSLMTFKTKMENLNDAIELFKPVDSKYFTLTQEGKEVMGWEKSKKVIETWFELIQENKNDFLTSVEFDQIQNSVKEKSEASGKFLFMPIRVAVIGQPHGADLKMLVPLLQKSSLLERAQTVLKS